MSAKIQIDFNDVLNRIKNGEKLLSIADSYGISRTNFSLRLKKEGFGDNRLFRFNHDYFRTIDTEEKAYWLGFLMADGCLFERQHPRPWNGSTKAIILCVNNKDHEHLLKFNKALNSTNKISLSKKDNCARTMHCSIKMYNDLISFGCTPNKSLTLKFPLLIESLIKHYIRGYIDGDGCISIKDKENGIGSIVISYIGTLDMMNNLNKHFCVFNKYRKVGENTYTTAICGNIKAMRILDWLYQDSTIYLERKYEIYIKHKDALTRRLHVW